MHFTVISKVKILLCHYTQGKQTYRGSVTRDLSILGLGLYFWTFAHAQILVLFLRSCVFHTCILCLSDKNPQLSVVCCQLIPHLLVRLAQKSFNQILIFSRKYRIFPVIRRSFSFQKQSQKCSSVS